MTMHDYILESIFLDTTLWQDAVAHGVGKHISYQCLEKISDPHIRADICIAIGEGRYKIIPPHTGYRKKDDGSERMFLANEPQDRILLNVIYKWLMRNESKMIHHACKSYQNGIGIGKIVKDIANRLGYLSGKSGNVVVGRKFDIHKYFESIKRDSIHQALGQVEKDFGASSVIDLLHEYYDSDIFFDSRKGNIISSYQGIKQGCAVSSWLANVLLFSLDEELSKREGIYIRYSDDILYIGDDYEEVTDVIRNRLSQIGLDLNNRKIIDIKTNEYFCFLGYDICGREITLSHKWVKNFQHEIDKRTIKNTKLIRKVRSLRRSHDSSYEKLNYLIEKTVRNVCRYLYYGNGRFSWATEVLPVVTNESDIQQLTLYCLDAIRAVCTGHTNIGGLGKTFRQGIQRGKGRNVKSNFIATRQLTSAVLESGRVTGFLSLFAAKKIISNRWLFRTIAANSVDTVRHPMYGQGEHTEISKYERTEIINQLESLYSTYKYSLPNGDAVERFYALSLDDMSSEMLIIGESHKEALINLEQHLVTRVSSSVLWDNNIEWYWQSQQFPELVLLREWFM